MPSTALRCAALALVLVLLAPACGEDDGGEATPSGSGSASGSVEEDPGADGEGAAPPVALEGEVEDHGTGELEGEGETELELDDFYFGPTYLRGEPGSTVTLALVNEGDAPHTFTIDALDVDTEVAPGESTEVEVTLGDQGATVFYCRFHQGQGMQGAIFFEEGDEVTPARAGAEPPAGPYNG